MDKKYKIVYRKNECIGAGACEYAFPEAWFFDRETSIATLKSSEAIKSDEREELIINQDLFEKHFEAARACPVHIIEIFDLETGDRVYPEVN